MSWVKQLPLVAGRYWWRAPDRFSREVHQQYGLLLLAWTEPSLVRVGIKPELRIRSFTTFNGSIGGELEGGGWSTGSTYAPAEIVRAPHLLGIEFWDEAVRGPGDFMPLLPDAAPYEAPDPVVVAAKRAEAAKKSAERDASEKAEFDKRVTAARAAGEVLYRCDRCHEVHDRETLVQVRECTHCDEKFNGTENGQACPGCNRTFTRNVTELGCPDCLEEDDCEPLAETPMPEKKGKKRR